MGMAKKPRRAHKPNVKLTRKQQRKEKRKEKKVRRNEFYSKRKKPGQFVLNPNKDSSNSVQLPKTKEKAESSGKSSRNDKDVHNKVLTTEQVRNKEQKEQKKIQKEMQKQRSKQLLEANIAEDRTIRQLEKQLKLNKRTSKSVPKTFAEDGLDYLLEVCDSDSMKAAVTVEQELHNVNEDFEEDFALMTGDQSSKSTKKGGSLEGILNEDELSDEEDEDGSEFSGDDLSENEDSDVSVESEVVIKSKGKGEQSKKLKQAKLVDVESSDEASEADIKSSKQTKTLSKRKKDTAGLEKSKKARLNEDINEDERNNSSDNESVNSNESKLRKDGKKNSDGAWEDIYGRLRAEDGAIINSDENKYIPPAIRARMESSIPEDKKRSERLSRLKKQLKGLLNRLAESNMHNIASQIEDLYMNNSRNDMNDTLTSLITESLISPVVVPERLLIEHVVLITVLHANVGTEVGAYFLQIIVKKFDEFIHTKQDVENKMLDNVVNVISQLYNFKLFDAKLLYEILNKFSGKFEEKDVECILHILKSVGFTLRKDDPLSLKNLILELQKKAATASEDVRDNPRVKFMLDVLLAIKNNNVTKIPNYDTSYSEHLKKIMKGFIRKGNYVTQLNISLEDLLKVEERGRWWVVGSAWTGSAAEKDEVKQANKSEGFSKKLLELARKQRMNTDTRRNVFCILMSAEDYLDAFEKLLRLGLKNQQERDIINVILHCCLQEKNYNPYYAVLTQKFCEYDRKYQMTIKCSVWDKLKSLSEHSGSQISNLAKMLTHLFIEKGLPISTLKIVQFSELDKVTLRFIRQILLGILLYKDVEACLAVFEKVAQSDKLKLFRESLRLFIHHFLLRNLKSDGIPEHQKTLLESRAKMVEKVLVSKEGKTRF